MRDWKIKLSMADFVAIKSVDIYKKVNEHGYARITGVISDSEEEALLRKAEQEDYAVISIINEKDASRNIFAGLIEQVEIQNLECEKIAEISLRGATLLMESEKRTRTFQDAGMQYQKLIQSVNESYHDVMYLQSCGGDARIGNMIVQYKENDWEFLKRLASHFNQPLIPDYRECGIHYSFGLNTYGKQKTLHEVRYRTGRNKEGFPYYEVKSREYFELGDKVEFAGTLLYVYEVTGALEHSEMKYTYVLRPASGFAVKKSYNMKLIGASLDASVLAIQNDTVKICTDADGKQDKNTAKWFPYSTVYSSPDGTGWYCMPEEGDKVRLYFPNEKEEEGYIISSVNITGAGMQKGAGDAPRSNPDRKSIVNKYQKQIELTPTSIIITNNKGMSITMDDEKGIDIVSDKKIAIRSEEELSVVSQNSKVNVEAKESIELVQGTSKLTMKDEVTIEGARLNVQ